MTEVAAKVPEGLKNLDTVLKAQDTNLRFVFMTGVSQFSKERVKFMQILDVIGCETPWGLKTIEVYHGDITQVTCDVLAISAFHDNYFPVNGTVIQALEMNCDVSVENLNENAFLDLRHDFCLWISQLQENQLFKYLVCVENMGTENAADDMTNDVFCSIGFLEAKKIRVASMALPLIGTGSMMQSVRSILPGLIENARSILRKHEYLRRVLFVEYDDEKARLIQDELRQSLGSSYADLQHTDQLIKSLRDSVLADVQKLYLNILPGETIMEELRALFASANPSTIEIGVLSRKLAEFVADRVVTKDRRNLDLYQKINLLFDKEVAPWLIFYLHALRVMGNEVVHIREDNNRQPKSLSEKDIAICLLCIQSTLGFIAENPARFGVQ